MFVAVNFQIIVVSVVFFFIEIEMDNLAATVIQDISYINKVARLLEVTTIFSRVCACMCVYVHRVYMRARGVGVDGCVNWCWGGEWEGNVTLSVPKDSVSDAEWNKNHTK